MKGNPLTYQIRVRLLSEAIFASGEAEQNLVHSKVLTDQYGFVYFHAKSFKGQLKKQAFWLYEQYERVDPKRADDFLQSIIKLFGINVKLELRKEKSLIESSGIALSNLELSETIRNYFIEIMSEEEEEGYRHFSPSDLIEAQTAIRTQIQLGKDGTALDKQLTTIQTVKEGLVFYSTVTFYESPTKKIVDDLNRIVCSLNRIGAGVHRGRGEIEAQLLCQGVEVNCNREEEFL